MRYTNCVALLTWPDGGRRLIGRDGVSVLVEPTLWHLKEHAAHLEEKVGADRQVTMPARPQEAVPRPWTRKPTRVAGRMLIDPTMTYLTGVVPVAALFLVVVLLAPGEVGFGAAVLLGPTILLGIVNARLARARLLKRAAKHNAHRR